MRSGGDFVSGICTCTTIGACAMLRSLNHICDLERYCHILFLIVYQNSQEETYFFAS